MKARLTSGPTNVEPNEVVVSCVFECKKHLGLEALLLYRSLDLAGGMLTGARRRAYCVGPLNPVIGDQLGELSVDVVEIEPVIPGIPLANKIGMFDPQPSEKVVVALDTDIAVVGEMWPWISDEVVSAKPVDQNPFSLEQWGQICNHLHLTLAPNRFRTHFHHALTPPYFNSGVIVVPAPWARDLAAVWTDMTVRLNSGFVDIDPNLESLIYYTEQVAFALALHELELPMAPLPLAMNFPTHQPVHVLNNPATIIPVLLHHHHVFDERGIGLTGYANVDSAIRQLNRSEVTSELVDYFGPGN